MRILFATASLTLLFCPLNGEHALASAPSVSRGGASAHSPPADYGAMGLKTPEALEVKWREVRHTALQKYERVRDSDLGSKLQQGASRARNSETAKTVWAKAGQWWRAAMMEGKKLVLSADRKLHQSLE